MSTPSDGSSVSNDFSPLWQGQIRDMGAERSCRRSYQLMTNSPKISLVHRRVFVEPPTHGAARPIDFMFGEQQRQTTRGHMDVRALFPFLCGCTQIDCSQLGTGVSGLRSPRLRPPPTPLPPVCLHVTIDRTASFSLPPFTSFMPPSVSADSS